MSVSLTLLLIFNLYYQYRLILILCREMVINVFVLVDNLSENSKYQSEYRIQQIAVSEYSKYSYQ